VGSPAAPRRGDPAAIALPDVNVARTGADALMYEWLWRHAFALGYAWGESSWILETNAAMRNALERMGFAVNKTCRQYDRPL